MVRSKPRLYRSRLWLAKQRRHLNQWILRRLFSFLERLTICQLRLLSKRANLQNQLESNPSQQQNLQCQLLQLNLQFPVALNQVSLLEDLQLLSRVLITRLSDKG